MSKKKGEILIREAPENSNWKTQQYGPFQKEEVGLHIRENIEEIGPHTFPETLFYVIQRK